MDNTLIELFKQYGYLAVFISVAIDHTGIPVPLILFSMLAITFGLDINLVALVSFLASMVSDLLLYFLGFRVLRLIRYSKKLTMEKLAQKEKNVIVIMGRYYPFVGRYMAAYWGATNYDFRRFFYLSALGNMLTIVVFCYFIYFVGNSLFAEYFLDHKNSLIISGSIVVLTLIPIFIRWIIKKKK